MNTKTILLVCDQPLADELSPALNAKIIRQGNPYKAIQAVKDSGCSVMIITSLQKDIESFCKAAKRINTNLKICVISSVADEPEILKLDGKTIDNYLIYPPNENQLEQFSNENSLSNVLS